VAGSDWFWIRQVGKSELGAELEGTEGVRTHFILEGMARKHGRAACSDQSQARASCLAEAANKKYGLTGGGQHLEYRGYDGLKHLLWREFTLPDMNYVPPERNHAQRCQSLAAWPPLYF
jgi:hypothetical protein